MYHEVSHIVCFQIFSVKCKKKMICIENIGFLGVLEKIYLLLQFHRQSKINYCISFEKPWSRLSQAAFLKIQNKIQKNIFKTFPYFSHFYAYFVVFLLETDEKQKKNTPVFNSFVCFNHLGQKLWEKIDFLQKKCNFSGEGKNISKHNNINYVKNI